jgi:hypothetical protein
MRSIVKSEAIKTITIPKEKRSSFVLANKKVKSDICFVDK